jgi:hypothetical protein
LTLMIQIQHFFPVLHLSIHASTLNRIIKYPSFSVHTDIVSFTHWEMNTCMLWVLVKIFFISRLLIQTGYKQSKVTVKKSEKRKPFKTQ